MSSAPFPLRGIFQPRFILPNELSQWGLPDANKQPAILSFVDAASSLIDQHCGRTDGTGQGSLVYSTYFERLLLQARNRNILRATFKPLVAVGANVVNNLQASANALPVTPAGKPLGNTLLGTNYFWTGCQANTIPVTNVPGSTVSPIIGASGRYGYPRRSDAATSPDPNYGMNMLQVASFFGGPPGFVTIDATKIDFDVSTGEMWIPAGLYMSSYTEIVIAYNSGYDPLNMPRPIKQATVMLIRNFLSRGGGTTGLRSINTAGIANVNFSPELIDITIERMLDPFKNIVAY